MASCVRNIFAKNYQNLINGFQVTVKNVGDVFLRHSVYTIGLCDSVTVRVKVIVPRRKWTRLTEMVDELHRNYSAASYVFRLSLIHI